MEFTSKYENPTVLRGKTAHLGKTDMVVQGKTLGRILNGMVAMMGEVVG